MSVGDVVSHGYGNDIKLPGDVPPGYNSNDSSVGGKSGVKKAEQTSLNNVDPNIANDSISQSDSTPTDVSVAKPDSPQLPKVDTAAFKDAIKTLERITNSIVSGKQLSEEDKQALNSWLGVSSAIDLFISSTEIASLIAKMALEDSKLKQAVGSAIIAMAQDAKNLTVAIGNMNADQLRLDAQMSMYKVAMAAAQAVSTVVSAGLRSQAEEKLTKQFVADGGVLNADAKLKISTEATASTQTFDATSKAILEAGSSFLQAQTDYSKADIEMSKALADGTKQVLDKMGSLLQDTYSSIGEDQRTLRDLMQKYMDMVKTAQDTSAQIGRG